MIKKFAQKYGIDEDCLEEIEQKFMSSFWNKLELVTDYEFSGSFSGNGISLLVEHQRGLQ